MPAEQDFTVSQRTDVTVLIQMTPPTAVGGWDVEWSLTRRFGTTSGLVVKSAASGFSATSGVTVTNSGNGLFTVSLRAQDTSGRDPGNYAWRMDRTTSGSRTALVQGTLTLEY